MRLTVNLDEDVYAMARSFAHARDISVSAAVNELLRRSLDPVAPLPMAADGSGWPVVAGKQVVTLEDVKALDDE